MKCSCGNDLFLMAGRVYELSVGGYGFKEQFVVCGICGLAYNSKGQTVTKLTIPFNSQAQPKLGEGDK